MRMKWFKHMSNARNEKKLSKLMLKHGIIGYGIYFFCLESIAEQINGTNIDFELKYDSAVLADRFKISQFFQDNFKLTITKEQEIKIVEDIMKDLIESNFFQMNSRGQIFCWKLAERIDNSIVKNPQLKIIKSRIQDMNIKKLTAPKNSESGIPVNTTTSGKIPETLLNESDFPEIPGNDELMRLFPENSGKKYRSGKIPENFRENLRNSRPDLELDSDKELELEREGFPGNSEITTLSPPVKLLFHDWVYLTNLEYKELAEDYGITIVNTYIKKLNYTIGSNPQDQRKWRKKDHCNVLRRWLLDDEIPVLPKMKKKTCPDCGKRHDYINSIDNRCRKCTEKELERDRKENGPIKLKKPGNKYQDEIQFF